MAFYRRRFLPPKGPPPMSNRERVLAEWRGIHLAPVEKAAAVSTQATSNVLARVVAGLKLDRRRAEAEIGRTWNDLIDPTITAHAQPAGLAKGTLFVTVDSNVWLTELLRYRRREILERLQHAFGSATIRKISFRVG